MATDADEREDEKRVIVRDANFVRMVADQVVVMDFGRDIEFALLSINNPVIGISQVQGESGEVIGEKIESRREWLEAGRVRMPPVVALNAAMNVISRMIADDQLDVDALRKSIEEMIENASFVESEGPQP